MLVALNGVAFVEIKLSSRLFSNRISACMYKALDKREYLVIIRDKFC